MTDTQDISNDLSAWIDGELPDARAKQVAEAVQADPALAAEADELRQVASLISQLGGPDELPANFAQRVAEQAIQHKTNHFPRWASLCVAASVLMATGTALMLFHGNETYETPLAHHAVEDADREDGRTAEVELADNGVVELRDEAEAIRRPSRGIVEKIAAESLNDDRAKKGLDLDFDRKKDTSASRKIAVAKPSTPPIRFKGKGGGNQKLSDLATKVNMPPPAAESTAAARRYTGKGRGYKGRAEQPAEVAITPVATKPGADRSMGKKSSGYAKAQDAEVPWTSRAGPGRYDVATNMEEATREAQATITLRQSTSPIVRKASTIVVDAPGSPPGQKPIQFHAFLMDQELQPKNYEQTETVYVKSLEAGQQRVEGLLIYNGIELARKNQPLLNNAQAVAVREQNAAGLHAQQLQTNSPDVPVNSKVATPAASQVQYMVFGGKSQIKELRSQVRVLNASNEMARAKKAEQADTAAGNESVKVPEKEITPAPILADLKPTPIPDESDAVQTETIARTSKSPAKARSARPTPSEPLRQIKTPAVDILIITVEERK